MTTALAQKAPTQTAMTADPRLIVALDLPTTAEARAMADGVGDAVSFYKIGLQLFAGDGMALARELKGQGKQVFLDWKLHDIGATVEKATAGLAQAGCDGVIASPREAAVARRIGGPGFLVVTPGVRPIGAALDDQARSATPAAALQAGASHLVVGRPITAASNPRAAAEAIVAEMAGN